MVPPRDFALFNQQRKQPSPAARSRLLRLDCRHPEKPALAAAFDGRDECPVSFRQIAPPPGGEQMAKTSRFTGTVPSLPVFSVPRQASPPSLKSPASCASLSHLLRAYINKPSTDCILRVKGGWRASPALLGPLPIEHTTTPADCRDWHSPHTRPEHRHTRPHLVTHRAPSHILPALCCRLLGACALASTPADARRCTKDTYTQGAHSHRPCKQYFVCHSYNSLFLYMQGKMVHTSLSTA